MPTIGVYANDIHQLLYLILSLKGSFFLQMGNNMKKTYFSVENKDYFNKKLISIFSDITKVQLSQDYVFKDEGKAHTLLLKDGDRLVYEMRTRAVTGDLYVKWKVVGPKETKKGIEDRVKDSCYFLLCVRKNSYGPPPVTSNYRDE